MVSLLFRCALCLGTGPAGAAPAPVTSPQVSLFTNRGVIQKVLSGSLSQGMATSNSEAKSP